MTEKQISDSLKLHEVPAHLHGGIVRYIVSGIRPGAFLCAILANDLLSAVCRADDLVTIEQLRTACKWINLEAPDRCHGSAGIVADWISAKAKEFGIRQREEITK